MSKLPNCHCKSAVSVIDSPVSPSKDSLRRSCTPESWTNRLFFLSCIILPYHLPFLVCPCHCYSYIQAQPRPSLVVEYCFSPGLSKFMSALCSVMHLIIHMFMYIEAPISSITVIYDHMHQKGIQRSRLQDCLWATQLTTSLSPDSALVSHALRYSYKVISPSATRIRHCIPGG